MIGWLRLLPYRKKLVLFCTALFLLAAAIQLGVTTIYFRDVIFDKSQIYFQETLAQVATRVDTEIAAREQMMIQIAESPSLHYNLYDLMEQTISKNVVVPKIMREVLRYKPGKYYDVRDFYIFARDFIPVNCYYSEALDEVDAYSRLIIQRLKSKLDKNVIWDDAYKERDWISAYAPIADQGELIGLIRVRFEKTFLRDIVDPVEVAEGNIVAVADATGLILYANNPDMIGRYTRYLDEHQNFVLRAPLDACSWSILGIIPRTAVLGQIAAINTSFMLVYAISFVIVLCVFSMFAKRTLAPLLRIVGAMKEVEEGNLDVRLPIERSDEFGYISERFNSMIDRVQSLLAQVYDYRDTLYETQLANLSARLHPHFLYNTLDTIYWSLITQDNLAQGDMILRLSNMLRYSLSDTDDLAALWKDFAELDSYILLQKSRFGDSLQYTIDLPEPMLDIRVPKLLLQPIVENCFKHAFVCHDRQWRIDIACALEGDSICLTVRDNGVGMSPEAARAAVRSGIGLRLIQDRIEHTYGVGYGLQIESACGQGTRVTVRIAARPPAFLTRGRTVPPADRKVNRT